MASNKLFSSLLIQLFNNTDAKAVDVVKYINDNLDTKISVSTITAYKRSGIVPSYEKARAILEYFNYDLSEDELNEMLIYSRNERKNLDKSTIKNGLSLKPANFNLKNVDQLSVVLKKRIDDLYEQDGSFNKYVTDLIKRDLLEVGLIK